MLMVVPSFTSMVWEAGSNLYSLVMGRRKYWPGLCQDMPHTPPVTTSVHPSTLPSPSLNPTQFTPESYIHSHFFQSVQPPTLPSSPLNPTQSAPQFYPVCPSTLPSPPSILPSPPLNPTQSTPQPYPVLPLLPRSPSSVYLQQEKEQHSRKHVLPMTRRKRKNANKRAGSEHKREQEHTVYMTRTHPKCQLNKNTL